MQEAFADWLAGLTAAPHDVMDRGQLGRHLGRDDEGIEIVQPHAAVDAVHREGRGQPSLKDRAEARLIVGIEGDAAPKDCCPGPRAG